MRLIRGFVVVIGLALALSGCRIPAVPGAPAVAWTGGAWFDGTAFRVVDVYTVGDRVTLTPPPVVAVTEDLSGRFVVPPFGEAHNHNLPGAPTEATIRRYIDEGVLYVMIQGNAPLARLALDGLVNHARSVDAVFANGLFTAPRGHPSALVERNVAGGVMVAEDLDGGFLLPVETEDDVNRLWERSVRAQTPDFVKVVLVYSEDRRAGVPRPDTDRHGLSPDLLPSIVARARVDGLRVSAHVESAVDFGEAVDAGVDLIAHLPGFWPDPTRLATGGADVYRISEQAARTAAERRVVVVTTLGEGLRNLGDDSTPAPYADAMRQVYRDNLRLLQENGVRLAVGSDQFGASSIGEALGLERAAMMDRSRLLRALTFDAVAAIFPDRIVGAVEGARADFLVLRSNPLDDFDAILTVERRVKSGRTLLSPGD